MTLRWPSLVAVCLLALLHVLMGPFERPERPRRRAWLSAAAGVSVAYVFVDLLPDLAVAQRTFTESGVRIAWLEEQLYLAALAGLVAAYGIDCIGRGAAATDARFWIHVGAFAIYNVLIGALIGNLREPAQLVLATGALGTHFYVNDRALAREHASSSGPAGRYLLALAVLVGWATADIQSAHPRAHAVVQALLAGGIVLNSLNEELPEGNDGRFGPFAAGIVSYTALMLLFLRALRS